ncbi:metalloprotease [Nostocoides sp. F2B08]|uniref:protealysin inhibitor emfourin n=1 Tax=Nostocoides sp. F2B08 TaxID=2653936 RepID=UPI001262BB6A|nr:protealysin inhibitor emfourin [Tetrasphaera sp. F2B08]KAB7745076.1 metalloprotease [Tetrasphaera sp. F2B08]
MASSSPHRSRRDSGPPRRTVHPCTIIPPYVLEALEASGDPVLQRHARLTMEQDAELRRHRGSPTAAPPRPETEQVPSGVEAAAGRPNRTVFDARGGTGLPGERVRGEGDPATGDIAVDEAYAGLGATHALWWAEYDRDSLDGRGLPLLATVHYGRGYDNAFWDGDQMVFGDGDGVIFDRFTASLDVIGHELAHGVTQYTSGLVYRGQPGALNEHVSDVFGVLVVQRELGQRADQADWLVGADLLLPGVSGVALRSMREPGTAYDDPRLGRDPQPAHMDDFVVTAADYGGVHINSGIPNRAFVLAATAIGGFAWERAGRIWVDAITGDIDADCDFATFAALTESAAARRFGTESVEHGAVREAWQAVGVVAAGSGAPSDRATPPPGSAVSGVVDAEVLVRRSGGFTGLVRERRVRLDELEPADARAWAELLTGPELRAAAARAERAGAADRYSYAVCCDEPPVDVEVPETALDEPTRELLDRALEADR